MNTTNEPSNVPRGQRLAGRIFSALPILFLGLDGVAKLFKPVPVVEGTIALGYPESSIIPMGLILLGSTLLYAIPRTAVLGAVLLTGYLGGAVATHVRVSDPLFSHTLSPVYVGILIWGGLLLRDRRLRAVFPLRTLPGSTEPVTKRAADVRPLPAATANA